MFKRLPEEQHLKLWRRVDELSKQLSHASCVRSFHEFRQAMEELEAIRAKLHNHDLAVQRSNMKAFLEGVKIGQRMKEKEAKQHAKGARVS